MKSSTFIAVLLATSIYLPSLAMAQDSPELRTKAAERYLKSVPTATMMEDAFVSLAQQLPPDQREKFLQDMRSIVHVEFLESVSKEKMVKVFTADELNALANFYESKDGSSAMKKFGLYLGEIMPVIQKEITQAVSKLQSQKK